MFFMKYLIKNRQKDRQTFGGEKKTIKKGPRQEAFPAAVP